MWRDAHGGWIIVWGLADEHPLHDFGGMEVEEMLAPYPHQHSRRPDGPYRQGFSRSIRIDSILKVRPCLLPVSSRNPRINPIQRGFSRMSKR